MEKMRNDEKYIRELNADLNAARDNAAAYNGEHEGR
jgi:hypothetical protein